MSRLENWKQEGEVVYGQVHDDDRFPQGYFIRTSKVIKLDREAKTLQTQNTLYDLGKESNDHRNQG